ncbi:NAD-dependent epimerase/dehydratase family protein [Nitrospirota bacterium]
MGKKVLITGGAGFAGTGLTKRLIKSGHKVTCLDFLAPNHRGTADTEGVVHLWKAVQDIQPSDIEGHDIVVHLQAQADVPMGFTSPIWTTDQNVMGIVHVLEAVRQAGIEKFIYAGSGNEWGRPQYLPIDENHPLTPHNPYSFSKAAAEMACKAWNLSYGVPIVLMSNGACLGPEMRRNIFIYIWLRNIIMGKSVILEGGEQTRDLTYVTDILDAWELTINAPTEKVVGEKFQVSYGEEVTVKDILEMCFKATGKCVEVIHKPYRPGEEGQREFFDNSKARKVLGYNPVVSPYEGIEHTFDWMKTFIS